MQASEMHILIELLKNTTFYIIFPLIVAYITATYIKSHSYRWSLKRKACLRALSIIDAFHSNVDWKEYKPLKQKLPKIEYVRECHSLLRLTCDYKEVEKQFLRCIPGLSEEIKGDYIEDLRHAIRKELGFDKSICDYIMDSISFFRRLFFKVEVSSDYRREAWIGYISLYDENRDASSND